MDATDNTLICPECQNKIEYNQDIALNDIFECKICGAEFEVIAFDPNKKPVISIVEEEK